MNKTELVAVAADKVSLRQADVEKVLSAVTDVILETLSKGEKVVITGFGTFEVRERMARNGKNPRTGEAITIPGQKTPAFKAGKLLKAAVK